MARGVKSPVRKISNRGPRPRFTGYCPVAKSEGSTPLVFDSITGLLATVYLDWHRSIARLAFEPTRHRIEIDGETFNSIPDFSFTDVDGQEGLVEAKYDLDALEPQMLKRLGQCYRWYTSQGYAYIVVDRMTLERSGFIQTIMLLRRYRQLKYSATNLERARACLAKGGPATLSEYRRRAWASGVSLGLLYVLLYREELPLHFEPFVLEELALCRL